MARFGKAQAPCSTSTWPPMSSPQPSPRLRPTRRQRAPERRRAAGALGLIAACRRWSPAWSSARGHEDSARARRSSASLAAWERGDYGAMYAQLGPPGARGARRPSGFARTLPRGGRDADAAGRHDRAARARPPTAQVDVPVAMRTRIFGTVRGHDAAGGRAARRRRGRRRLARRTTCSPGLRRGEQPRAPDDACRRARRSLARDGTRARAGRRTGLATLGPAAAEVVGHGRPRARRARRRARARRACPTGAPVGLTGLEREFDERAAPARPAARCYAGRRVLATRCPQRGGTVRTTIDAEGPEGRGRGARRALRRDRRRAPAHRRGARARRASPSRRPSRRARRSRSSRSPARCSAGVVKRTARFPVADRGDRSRASSSRTPTARRAAGRSRRPSPSPATRSSPRSAPSSARAGSSPPPSASASTRSRRSSGAARSTIPRRAARSATTSRSARRRSARARCWPRRCRWRRRRRRSASAACARCPRCCRAAPGRRVARARRRAVARTIGRSCARWSRYGTGVGAAIPGVEVAGKTGTAELRTHGQARTPQPLAAGRAADPAPQDDTTDTDAWFAALRAGRAPARGGRRCCWSAQGAGGATAAPAARAVLQAALKR